MTRLTDAFWARVDVRGDGECWPWKGALNRKGYGITSGGDINRIASRAAWILHAQVTPPSTLLVCHTCHNRDCCNPAHLYLGTPSDNNRDCIEAGRHPKATATHCSRGHEFTPENIKPRSRVSRLTGLMQRECRECYRINRRKWWAKTRDRRITPADAKRIVAMGTA